MQSFGRHFICLTGANAITWKAPVPAGPVCQPTWVLGFTASSQGRMLSIEKQFTFLTGVNVMNWKASLPAGPVCQPTWRLGSWSSKSAMGSKAKPGLSAAPAYNLPHAVEDVHVGHGKLTATFQGAGLISISIYR